jgi:hypothetical protein
MSFQGRRGLRGAFRATPEEILRQAIAAHRALKERERWQAGRPGADEPPARSPRRTTEAARRRAQFAAAIARAAFGRFYRKDPRDK